MMLHATAIEFLHPETDQKILINTDVPFPIDNI
jgi:23S rRNA-/tRNA-specific pseudouridylate synthase